MFSLFASIITGRERGKYGDAKNNSTNLQVQDTAKDDIKTAQYVQQAGIDSNPPDGAIAVVLNITDSWKVCIAVNDGTDPASPLEPGEEQLYGQDNGVRTSTITCKKDGSIEIKTLSSVTVVGDVIADGISLKTHTHLGNLGFDTLAPTVGTPVAAPGSLPGTNANGDIIGGDGVNLSTHIHSQANDTNGDTEEDTGTPHA
jgi:phage gp45-like